jgi:peptidoglycan hydrolase-like protein with peptidoglycan-binding domain
MSRSFWAAAITVLVMSLIPGVALAANSTSSRSSGASAQHESKQPRVDRVVLEPGSGLSLPGGAVNVRSLQRQLVWMGFSPGPVDGRYGPLTTQAVKRFQQAHGLVADGIVGPQTHKALAGGSLVSGAGYLQRGGSPAVRSLQRRLSRAGFSPGPADGRYGPLTAQAVKRFQHAHRLTADGIAGGPTVHALASRRPKASSPQRHTASGPRHHAAPRPHRHANPTSPQPQTTPAIPKPQTAPTQHATHGSSWLKWVILAVLIVIAVLVLVGPDRRPKRATAQDAKAAPQNGAGPSATAAVAPTAAAAAAAPIAVTAARALAASKAAAEPSPSPTAAAAPIAVAAAAASVAAGKSAADPRPAPEEATPEPPPVRETPAPVPADAPPVPAQVQPPSEDPLPALEQAMLASESAVAVSSEVRAERAERVKALQRQLSWLGLEPGPVDGQYGPVTGEAVKRFQEVRDLPASGVADPMTLRALRAGTPERPFSGRVQRVTELQRQLTALGFDPGPIDGRYGPATTEAVKRFQEANDLPVDGVADPQTLSALRKSTPQRAPGRRVERVKELQRQLAGLGLSPGPVDGRYGPATTGAVKRFQEASDLPVHGVADPLTLNALRARIRGRPFTGRIERVKDLQRHLTALGLEPGPIDGRYGPATTEALKRFQQRHRLPMHGIADPHTLNALRKDIEQIPTPNQTTTPASAITPSPDPGGPDDADGAFTHALLLEEHGDEMGAMAAYQRADGLGHGAAAANLGVLLERHGDRTAAEASYRRADQRGDANGAFNLAILLEEQDDRMGAMAAYQRADGLGHGAAAANLGVLLERHGDRTAAEASYRRADRRGDANGAFNLAILLEEQGDHIGALRAYQRAEQLGHPELADMARAAALDLRRQSESPIAVGQGGGHDGP